MKAHALHWFTSDLRLDDNPALALAGTHGVVAGVFVRDPASMRRASSAPRRVAFLHACRTALDDQLRAHGARLRLEDGDPAVVLPRLAAALGVGVVTHARNHEPAARARATRVAQALAPIGVRVESAEAGVVHEP